MNRLFVVYVTIVSIFLYPQSRADEGRQPWELGYNEFSCYLKSAHENYHGICTYEEGNYAFACHLHLSKAHDYYIRHDVEDREFIRDTTGEILVAKMSVSSSQTGSAFNAGIHSDVKNYFLRPNMPDTFYRIKLGQIMKRHCMKMLKFSSASRLREKEHELIDWVILPYINRMSIVSYGHQFWTPESLRGKTFLRLKVGEVDNEEHNANLVWVADNQRHAQQIKRELIWKKMEEASFAQ